MRTTCSTAIATLFAAAVAAICCSAAVAAPVTLDFEGVASASGSATGIPYTSHGFSFNSTTKGKGADAIFGKSSSANTDGSAILAFCSFDSTCTSGTQLTLSGTDPFSLSSIDVANYRTGDVAGTLELVGHLLGGGTVSATLASDNTWDTFKLTGFSQLTSVDLLGHTTYAVAVDNLVINADAATTVPEPASLALVGLALFGAAAVRKRG